jgi:hypothetical protein
MPKPHEFHRPAHRDKSLGTTLLFAAVLVFNHKAQLNLAMGELMVLAAMLGGFMTQSQLGAVAKMRTTLGAAPAESGEAAK